MYFKCKIGKLREREKKKKDWVLLVANEVQLIKEKNLPKIEVN